jgi:hypothetical protein
MGGINIKMGLREFRWGKDRLDLVQNRDRRFCVVSAVTKCSFLNIWVISSLSDKKNKTL